MNYNPSLPTGNRNTAHHAERLNTAAAVSATRELPHSLDAEENLICVCFIDNGVIARCIEAGIASKSFYDPNHAMIWGAVEALHKTGTPVDTDTTLEELKKAGPDWKRYTPLLTQISDRQKTQLAASYFIGTVADYAKRREAIRTLGAATEELYTDTGTLADGAITNVVTWASSTSIKRGSVMQWDDLLSFDPKNDPDCLLGNRLLCRGDGALIVAPSGVGKSVLSFQLAACCALGRPLFGLKVAAPLRVLYAQAEDNRGDVGEAAQGFVYGLNLTRDELAQLRQRMRIVRWNDCAGDAFLARLRAEHARFQFDLAIINPLFSFCGCDVAAQVEMSRFLRNGLNPILTDLQAAAVIVHHTPKIRDDGKDNKGGGNIEASYSGFGSVELTNWPRTYIVLQQVKAAGGHVFKMNFAKRGNRAGLVDEEGKFTTSVMIEHSARGLCWIPSGYTPSKDTGGKFTARFDLVRARQVYDPKLSWSENEQAIALDQDMDRRTVRNWKRQVLETE